jgi:hypothetical protein
VSSLRAVVENTTVALVFKFHCVALQVKELKLLFLGEWNNSKKHGTGVFTLTNGTKYKGTLGYFALAPILLGKIIVLQIYSRPVC